MCGQASATSRPYPSKLRHLLAEAHPSNQGATQECLSGTDAVLTTNSVSAATPKLVMWRPPLADGMN